VNAEIIDGTGGVVAARIPGKLTMTTRLQRLVITVLLGTTLHARAAEDDQWSFDFTLYGLLASLNGDITINDNQAPVDLKFSDLLDHIEFAAAGKVRVGYDRWFGALDVNFVGLGGSSENVAVDLDQWIVEPIFGYRVSHGFEVFAGARYVGLDTELRFQGPLGTQRSGTQDWWDPIIGAAVNVPLGEQFSFDLRGDVGGFGVGSRLALQGEALVNWHVSQRVALQLGYRAIYTDYEDSDEGFEYDVVMHGPQLGLKLSF
jgi:hypothetical protein